jgi:hypothetical protein
MSFFILVGLLQKLERPIEQRFRFFVLPVFYQRLELLHDLGDGGGIAPVILPALGTILDLMPATEQHL